MKVKKTRIFDFFHQNFFPKIFSIIFYFFISIFESPNFQFLTSGILWFDRSLQCLWWIVPLRISEPEQSNANEYRNEQVKLVGRGRSLLDSGSRHSLVFRWQCANFGGQRDRDYGFRRFFRFRRHFWKWVDWVSGKKFKKGLEFVYEKVKKKENYRSGSRCEN